MLQKYKPKGEIRNAKITNVSLGYKDCPLTMWITLDYGCMGQCFGGYSFTGYDKTKDETYGSAFGTEFIMNILDTLKVDDIFKLVGTPLRVDCSHCGVHGIGHYLEDKWFYPDELAKKFND